MDAQFIIDNREWFQKHADKGGFSNYGVIKFLMKCGIVFNKEFLEEKGF
jgi:hypothetical protein